MASENTLLNPPDLSSDDYVVVGLATCFVKDEGEVHQLTVLEPVPSAYLEALFKGVPTSYQSLHATTLGSILDGGTPKMLPEVLSNSPQFSQDFTDRAFAAARTYKSREVAQSLLPAGTATTEINYSTERKRVINGKNVVTAEDNVKQHQYTHMTL